MGLRYCIFINKLANITSLSTRGRRHQLNKTNHDDYTKIPMLFIYKSRKNNKQLIAQSSSAIRLESRDSLDCSKEVQSKWLEFKKNTLRHM